jgi:hypothetical protein
MTFKRLLASSAVFAFLILAAPAAGQNSGGGAVAPTGAPTAAPAADPSIAAPAPEPQVLPAQDDTPTTPEGEEQPPEEQPDGEQTPTEEDGGTENAPSGEAGGGTGESAGGLPQTGFEVAALTSIGLGLLLAGAALWPTSSWPPPRDRLSRSTRRR